MLIIGTRPNFMKMAPVYHALKQYNKYTLEIVHTDQHYDQNMSQTFTDLFFGEDIMTHLSIKGTPNQQISEIIYKLNDLIICKVPKLVIVFGDVNSTLAGALTANKLNIPIAHVESGLRCGDKTMPEEINRILVDHMSQYLFITDAVGIDNLKNEGINNNMYFVGNPMIDTLFKYKQESEHLSIYKDLGLNDKGYVLVTVHRQVNVDVNINIVCNILNNISKDYKIVFPVHPRTRAKITLKNDNIMLVDPLGYLQFINLLIHSGIVLTDSGACSEESSYLGVYCLSLRDSTERPVTCQYGTNILTGLDETIIKNNIDTFFGKRIQTDIPLWDGKSGERIAKIIADEF